MFIFVHASLDDNGSGYVHMHDSEHFRVLFICTEIHKVLTTASDALRGSSNPRHSRPGEHQRHPGVFALYKRSSSANTNSNEAALSC